MGIFPGLESQFNPNVVFEPTEFEPVKFDCNRSSTETDNDRYVNDEDGIFVMLLFSLYFICLNFASFLTAYLFASICFLSSTTHDKGPEI